MQFMDIPTDNLKGSIELFCLKLGAKLIEQTDHFAHLEFFEQEIIFHFDPSYRQEKKPGIYSFVIPEESDFTNIYKQCESMEVIRPLRTLAGHVSQKAFSVRGVSGHEMEFKHYLPMMFELKESEE